MPSPMTSKLYALTRRFLELCQNLTISGLLSVPGTQGKLYPPNYQLGLYQLAKGRPGQLPRGTAGNLRSQYI